jgi:hypothetical protein
MNELFIHNRKLLIESQECLSAKRLSIMKKADRNRQIPLDYSGHVYLKQIYCTAYKNAPDSVKEKELT